MINHPFLLLALATAFISVPSGITAQPAVSPPGGGKPFSAALISRADAQLLVSRTLDACEAMREPASVYVLDAEGNMRAAGSSDNAVPIGVRTAQTKAAAVLMFRSSTRALTARLASDKAFADQYGKDPRFFFHPGGVPIFRGGHFVGVVAAGGGHDADESCVLAAMATIPWAKPAA